jgi:DNA polymerase III subunit delta
MIIIIHGVDSYQSREQLEKLKARFASAQGSARGIHLLEDDKLTAATLAQALSSLSLFNEKRLIICKNALTSKKVSKHGTKQIAEFLLKTTLPSENTLVLYEQGKIDPRNPIWKAVTSKEQPNKHTVVMSYEMPAARLSDWMRTFVQERNGTIEPQAISALIASVGNDLWRLSSELGKLLDFKEDGQPITEADVREMVRADLNTNIFDLVDALGKKQRQRALQLLHDQIDDGQDPIYLVTMMTFQFRNLIMVKSMADEGMTNQQIAKQGKMHPFVVGKTRDQSKNFTMGALRAMFHKLYDADKKLKSSSGDPNLVLDSLVIALTIK